MRPFGVAEAFLRDAREDARALFGRLGRDLKGAGIASGCRCDPAFIVRAEHGERLFGFDGFARLFQDADACRMVDDAFLRLAPRAEHTGGPADHFGVHVRDIAGPLGEDFQLKRRLRQFFGIGEAGGIAALRLDHGSEGAKGAAVLDGLLCKPLALGEVAAPDEAQHVGGEREADLPEVGGSSALEHFHGFGDFERVADGRAQGHVHVGDDGRCLSSRTLADGDHGTRERERVVERLHEGAAARLDIEHDRRTACRELLAHDRGGDERNGVDRRRDVAQRIELLVSGRKLARLPDEGKPRLFYDGEKVFARERRLKARNGFELVDGAARVAEAAPAHLGDAPARRRDDGAGDERRLVADAARRVLVDRGASKGREVDLVARGRHGERKRAHLLLRHGAKADRHEHRRHLIVGNLAFRESLDHGADLAFSKRLAALLLRDEIIHAHGDSSQKLERERHEAGEPAHEAHRPAEPHHDAERDERDARDLLHGRQEAVERAHALFEALPEEREHEERQGEAEHVEAEQPKPLDDGRAASRIDENRRKDRPCARRPADGERHAQKERADDALRRAMQERPPLTVEEARADESREEQPQEREHDGPRLFQKREMTCEKLPEHRRRRAEREEDDGKSCEEGRDVAKERTSCRSGRRRSACRAA